MDELINNERNIDNIFLIGRYINRKEIQNYIKEKYLKRIKHKLLIKVISYIMDKKYSKIRFNEKEHKQFIDNNISRLNKEITVNDKGKEVVDYILMPQIVDTIKEDIIQYINRLDGGFEDEDKEDSKHDCIKINKDILFEKIREVVCNNNNNIIFQYDFDKPDLDSDEPTNSNMLQRCIIQINEEAYKFDYPIEYVYRCDRCNTNDVQSVFRRKTYEVMSVKNKIKCTGIYEFMDITGENKSKICGQELYPDMEISETKDCYMYRICYQKTTDNGKTININANAISFNIYRPGRYDCVLFKIKNPNRSEIFFIVDVKKQEFRNEFKIPDVTKGEHYAFSLMLAFDRFIAQQTNKVIYGMLPVKVALILQKMTEVLGYPLNNNIQLVGSTATGKSLVLKYYGFLLYNYLHMSSVGLSMSVAGLRGSNESIIIFGKKEDIISKGWLGTFKSIHIDEANQEEKLVENLKPFLCETNYSYNKKGGSGATNTRTCHVNLSENVNSAHIGQYRGEIRKIYKNTDTVCIDDNSTKQQWSEDWDLHQPLWYYDDNKTLRKVISDVRKSYESKEMYWIDGHDDALHQRFPFYFYLVYDRKKNVNKLLEAAVNTNSSRKCIEENVELINVLQNDNINIFFESLREYMDCTDDEADHFDKLRDVIGKYNDNYTIRDLQFFNQIFKLSRIINKRRIYTEEDYKFICWLIENTNCKVDIASMDKYNVKGAVDIKLERQKDLVNEELSIINTKDNQFGLQGDDFS